MVLEGKRGGSVAGNADFSPIFTTLHSAMAHQVWAIQLNPAPITTAMLRYLDGPDFSFTLGPRFARTRGRAMTIVGLADSGRTPGQFKPETLRSGRRRAPDRPARRCPSCASPGRDEFSLSLHSGPPGRRSVC